MAQTAKPILDVGLEDDIKPLVPATNPQYGDIYLHENQILKGYGSEKTTITQSYKPLNGISGRVESATFDILLTNGTSSNTIDVVDDLVLQIGVNLNSSAAGNNVCLKPIHHWFQKVEISLDGGTTLQNIYFDNEFAKITMDSFSDNISNLKSQLNLDPRNFLPWFDDQAGGAVIESSAAGAIVSNLGTVGKSAYLSQPYYYSTGNVTGAVSAGVLASYTPFAKGGFLQSGDKYTFYLPITGTVLQSAEVFLPALQSGIRFKFYMNNEVMLYDEGTGASKTYVNFEDCTLWVRGSKLSTLGYTALMEKYQKPVISRYTWYNEFISAPAAIPSGQDNDFILANLTGECSKLVFWIEDTRPNIAYPAANSGSDKYIQNNMMTLPIESYLFIDSNGSTFGTGTNRPQALVEIFNNFRQLPKSVYADERLYFRKYYVIDFSKNFIDLDESAVYKGAYRMTGKETLRIRVPTPPSVELNADGNDINAVTASALYSSCKLHVVAYFNAELVEVDGQLSGKLLK